MKLSVIAPTYNEADNVVAFVEAVSKVMDGVDFEVLIADDDSPDLTWQRVAEMSQRNPRIRVLRRTKDRGLGPAVAEGFCEARGEFVACMDADLQHDPAILPSLLDALEKGSDLAVGSRYLASGQVVNWNPIRRIGSWVATKLAQWLIGIKLNDPMSGYFMMRRADFLEVLPDLDVRGFKILLEIVARKQPRLIAEVPFTFGPRLAGKSKLSTRVVLQYVQQLATLFMRRMGISISFAKFGVVGALGVVVNLVALGAVVTWVGWRDWKASALATMVALTHNYILNNFWTFRDRARQGARLLTGYWAYSLISVLALLVTTTVYTVLAWAFDSLVKAAGDALRPSLWPLLLFQCAGILCGTIVNYELNRRFTWRDPPEHPR